PPVRPPRRPAHHGTTQLSWSRPVAHRVIIAQLSDLRSPRIIRCPKNPHRSIIKPASIIPWWILPRGLVFRLRELAITPIDRPSYYDCRIPVPIGPPVFLKTGSFPAP